VDADTNVAEVGPTGSARTMGKLARGTG